MLETQFLVNTALSLALAGLFRLGPYCHPMRLIKLVSKLRQYLPVKGDYLSIGLCDISQRAVVQTILFVAANVVVQRLTLFYGFYNDVAILWLPFAMAVAAFLLKGPRVWPVIVLSNLVSFYPFTSTWNLMFGTVLMETLAAVCCYSILRGTGTNLGFDRLRDLWSLVLAAFISSVLSLVGGIVFWDVNPPTLSLLSNSNPFTWWLSHVLACLIGLPLLSWTQPRLRIFLADRQRRLEFMAALLLTMVTAYLGFNYSLGVTLFLLPALCWSALRFGQAGASIAVFLISSVAACTNLDNNQLVLELEKHGFQLIPVWVQISVCFAGLTGTVLSIVVRAEALRQAAEEANKAKNQFVANFSHEIRNPLGVIAGFVELALPTDLRSAEGREYLLTIQRNAKQALHLVNDILDISKMEAGHLDIHLAPVLISELVDELREPFLPIADEKNIDLQFEVDPCVPELITTDQARVRQILANLLSNSLKFTRQGYVKLRLDCRLLSSRGSNWVELRFLVSDTGVGISEFQQSRLFQPFAHDGTGAQDVRVVGSGLGLALSRNLARLMDGNLELISSRENRGSTFALTLHAEFQEFSNVHPLRKRSISPRI